MDKLYCKIIAIWRIFFTDQKHWLLISFNEHELRKLLTDKKGLEFNLVYHGLQKYNVDAIIKLLESNIDNDQHVLDKALFEANALLKKEEQP